MGRAYDLAVHSGVDLSKLDGRSGDPDVKIVRGIGVAQAQAAVVGGVRAAGEVAAEGYVGVTEVYVATQSPFPWTLSVSAPDPPDAMSKLRRSSLQLKLES